MKQLTLALMTTSLLMVGCGGGGSDTPNVTEIKNLNDAEKSYKSLSALSSLDKIGNKNNNLKMSKLSLEKTGTIPCDSGSIVYNISDDAKTTSFTMKKCSLDTSYFNGTMSMIKLDDNSEKFELKNMTIKDEKMTMISSSFIFIDNEAEHWATMNGDMNIESKCFTGKYNFKTIEKMYEAQDQSDNVESGIIELNGATYTFANPHVTIKVGSQERTILQSALEKEIESSTTCSE